ncbi:hypothetical protein RDWZM_003802 [Blomia tropicalis]|uniref:Uncharacterized protein n=1 Tax=Blomia tropicalis TaxID=40697 RepID=A0A9Q0MIY4_BLOTA|nr:hypothetical protein RDWZM_003802 [Blomia tropicalis]
MYVLLIVLASIVSIESYVYDDPPIVNVQLSMNPINDLKYFEFCCEYTGISLDKDPASVPWIPTVAFVLNEFELGSFRYNSIDDVSAVYWHTSATIPNLNLYPRTPKTVRFLHINTIVVQNLSDHSAEGRWYCTVHLTERFGFGLARYVSNFVYLN